MRTYQIVVAYDGKVYQSSYTMAPDQFSMTNRSTVEFTDAVAGATHTVSLGGITGILNVHPSLWLNGLISAEAKVFGSWEMRSNSVAVFEVTEEFLRRYQLPVFCLILPGKLSMGEKVYAMPHQWNVPPAGISRASQSYQATDAPAKRRVIDLTEIELTTWRNLAYINMSMMGRYFTSAYPGYLIAGPHIKTPAEMVADDMDPAPTTAFIGNPGQWFTAVDSVLVDIIQTVEPMVPAEPVIQPTTPLADVNALAPVLSDLSATINSVQTQVRAIRLNLNALIAKVNDPEAMVRAREDLIVVNNNVMKSADYTLAKLSEAPTQAQRTIEMAITSLVAGIITR